MRKPKPFVPYEPVVVLWEDAHARSEQHESPETALKSYTPCMRKSIGFFVGQTEAIVVIAVDDDRLNNGGVASCSFIPAGMVRSIERVCLPPK